MNMSSRITSTKKTFRRMAAILSASALLVGAAACSSTETEGTETSEGVVSELRDRLPESIKERGVLRIATVTSTNPFTQKPGEEVIGLIPDLAKPISEKLGVDVEYIESPMSAQIAALQSDRADVSWSAMSNTLEREETINMVPYIKNLTQTIVQEGNPQGIETIEDMCGKTIASVRGGDNTAALEALNQKHCVEAGSDPIEILNYDKSADAILQVQSGMVDGFIGIGLQLKHIAETANDGKTFDYVPLTIVESTLSICTTKENTELAELMRDTVKAILESGEYDEVMDEYDAQDFALTEGDVVVNPVTQAQA